ncbi:hypothetical protein OG883_43590 [Streptomyces sp. NBC_01142]|uniref:hypothetical protein n=1 Tax=Streptomyces sp. NBC_01142 TaxID=2975865 RepID=UPI0022522EB7|nr:hypothetical protein [Streptomyces sp. NBC_01142]MCX4826524.1 hypothetical protein [Streptomyces sp. NBC_01142]
MSAPAPFEPVHPSLVEFVGMARSRLGNLSPAERRVKAAEAARDVLRRVIKLDLKSMSADELVLEVMEMRGALAGLLTVTVPAATPPARPEAGGLTDDDLVASLFDMISDVAPLEADVAVHIGRPLPNPLIDSLVRAINAPGLQYAGEYLEARGHCGTSTVHITAMALAGGAQ